MAGMFYSLQEAADKLKMTTEQVADLVKQGRLREFRVGENVSFKASEVEALTTDSSIIPAAQTPAEPLPQPQAEAQPEPPPQPQATQEPQPQPEARPQQQPEATQEPQPKPEPRPQPQPQAMQEPQPQPEARPQPQPQAMQEPQSQPEIKPQPPAQPEAIQEPQSEFELEPPFEPEPEMAADSGEISLAPEASVGDDTGDELLNADTFVSADGINVLGETDGAPLDTQEMLAETRGSGGEPSLEEIEEDVNLDTFGSGSGLLDLSLQADDTSLGGILDEIYTSESGQETSETSAIQLAPDAGPEAAIISEEEIVAGPEPEVMGEEAPAVAYAYAGTAPDRLTGWLGYLLWLPMLAVIYTAVVAVTGFKGVMPSVLEKLQAIDGPYGVHIIWYIAGGAALFSLAMVGLSFALGAPGAKAPKKPKVKKPKAPKPPKPPKRPKEPKKKKEKKK